MKNKCGAVLAGDTGKGKKPKKNWTWNWELGEASCGCK